MMSISKMEKKISMVSITDQSKMCKGFDQPSNEGI